MTSLFGEMVISGVSHLNLNNTLINSLELKAFLSIIELTPLMHWVAYHEPVPKGDERYDINKSVLMNITVPMMNKMAALFIEIEKEGQIKI